MVNFNTIPHIYIVCLAAYNSCYLHGRKIDATQDVETIQNQIQEMLSKSPIADAKGWVIHNQDNFGSIQLSKYNDFEEICQIAAFIHEHGELGAELVANFHNVEDAQEAREDNYHGKYSRELDFVIELFEEVYLHSIPDNLTSYIDYEAFRYDIFINDYYSLTINGDVHLFSSH